jgi:hypothetical protein
MKKIILSIISTFIIGMSFAQSVIDEAYVQYEITNITSEDPQMEAMLQMMKGSTLDIFFNDSQQRTDVDMMGGMMKMTTLMGLEGDSGNALFMDMMGRKIRVNMNEEELEQYRSKGAEMKPIVKKGDGIIKEIAGYSCDQMLCTFEGETSFELIAYVTKEISSPKSVVQNMGEVDLGGFPLEYTVVTPEMSLTYTAQKLETKLESDVFETPVGYEDMTFEQFLQTMGAMGGMGQ